MSILHYFFDLTSFYRLGQKTLKKFCFRFLVETMTSKNPFEIKYTVPLYLLSFISLRTKHNCCTCKAAHLPADVMVSKLFDLVFVIKYDFSVFN